MKSSNLKWYRIRVRTWWWWSIREIWERRRKAVYFNLSAMRKWCTRISTSFQRTIAQAKCLPKWAVTKTASWTSMQLTSMRVWTDHILLTMTLSLTILTTQCAVGTLRRKTATIRQSRTSWRMESVLITMEFSAQKLTTPLWRERVNYQKPRRANGNRKERHTSVIKPSIRQEPSLHFPPQEVPFIFCCTYIYNRLNHFITLCNLII